MSFEPFHFQMRFSRRLPGDVTRCEVAELAVLSNEC
jgi:hypothetical protein